MANKKKNALIEKKENDCEVTNSVPVQSEGTDSVQAKELTENQKLENATRKKLTALRKEIYLEALKKALGIQSIACERAKFCDKTINSWKHTDKVFARKVKEIEKHAIGLVEMAMFDRIINDKDPNLIKFFLLTRAKKKYSYDQQDRDKAPAIVMNVSKEEMEF